MSRDDEKSAKTVQQVYLHMNMIINKTSNKINKIIFEI